MTKDFIFDAWAPPSAIWSRWAKPVLFSQMDSIAPDTIAVPSTIDVSWAVDPNRATAVIVDLPGVQGVPLALSLAAIGYRPVPLYNACPAPQGDVALVNVRPIMIALASGASSLRALDLAAEAPPAFLLDSQRNVPLVTAAPGMFDNRSISLPTDFPSADFLGSRRIHRVVLVQPGRTEPQADLSHTLRRWQEAGLSLLEIATDQPDVPRPITVNRPSSFRLLWYNLLAKAGFKANPLGGFGGRLPMPR